MRELRRILRPAALVSCWCRSFVGVEETAEEQGESSIEYRWKHFGMAITSANTVGAISSTGLTRQALGSISLVSAISAPRKFRRHGVAANSVLYVVRR